MDRSKISNTIDTVSLILAISFLIGWFVTKDFTLMFYYWLIETTIIIIRILYNLYEYKAKFKKHRRGQLVSLRYIRSQLYGFGIGGTVLYLLFYNLSDYKSPFQDPFIVMLGVFVIISLIALTICIAQIVKKKQQLATFASAETAEQRSTI